MTKKAGQAAKKAKAKPRVEKETVKDLDMKRGGGERVKGGDPATSVADPIGGYGR
jgi:hypothetical protein